MNKIRKESQRNGGKNMNDKSSNDKELMPEQKQIADWLKKVKFKKKLVGGVNEIDVWKKIEELDSMYEEALKAQQIRCNTLIDYYKNLSSERGEDSDKEQAEYE